MSRQERIAEIKRRLQAGLAPNPEVSQKLIAYYEAMSDEEYRINAQAARGRSVSHMASSISK